MGLWLPKGSALRVPLTQARRVLESQPQEAEMTAIVSQTAPQVSLEPRTLVFPDDALPFVRSEVPPGSLDHHPRLLMPQGRASA